MRVAPDEIQDSRANPIDLSMVAIHFLLHHTCKMGARIKMLGIAYKLAAKDSVAGSEIAMQAEASFYSYYMTLSSPCESQDCPGKPGKW